MGLLKWFKKGSDEQKEAKQMSPEQLKEIHDNLKQSGFMFDDDPAKGTHRAKVSPSSDKPKM